MGEKFIWFSGKTCPVRGKEFMPAPQHGWLIGSELCPTPVCSYSCQRKWEKTHTIKSRQTTNRIPVRIVETGETFKSISACADKFGVDDSVIRHRLKTGETYSGLHIERVVE